MSPEAPDKVALRAARVSKALAARAAVTEEVTVARSMGSGVAPLLSLKKISTCLCFYDTDQLVGSSYQKLDFHTMDLERGGGVHSTLFVFFYSSHKNKVPTLQQHGQFSEHARTKSGHLEAMPSSPTQIRAGRQADRCPWRHRRESSRCRRGCARPQCGLPSVRARRGCHRDRLYQLDRSDPGVLTRLGMLRELEQLALPIHLRCWKKVV